MLLVTYLILRLAVVVTTTYSQDYQLDFVHSFLIKNNKLEKTKRLDSAEERWIKKTGYMVSSYFSLIYSPFRILSVITIID